MSRAAIEAFTDQLAVLGNPSSLHSAGRAARRVVEESRESVAASLGARPSEVIFTSGGTEADNLAIKGLFWSRNAANPARRRILVSAIEHHAVLDPASWLAEHTDAEVVLLAVDAQGVLDVAALRAELAEHGDEVALISVMWANNEIGAIQPVADIVAAARPYGIPVHADAVQAVAQVEVDFADSGLDAMTVTGHKLGGPVGVGALLVRRTVDVTPILHGGGQERGVRSGTFDTAGIRSFAVALAEATRNRPTLAPRITALRDRLIAGVLEMVPSATLRGPDPRAASGTTRLPGSAHFTFEGCEGDSLLYLLDSAGVQSSTGSACQAGIPQPSHVLLALGLDEDAARGALRFSLGATSTEADVDLLLEVLPDVVARASAAGLSTISRVRRTTQAQS